MPPRTFAWAPIARYYKSDAARARLPDIRRFAPIPRMTNAYNATDGDKREIQQYSLHFDAPSPTMST